MSDPGQLNRRLGKGDVREPRDGPSAGLKALREIERPLADYHLFYAARADFLERAGKAPSRDLRKAISLVKNDGERRLLQRRLQDRGA